MGDFTGDFVERIRAGVLEGDGDATILVTPEASYSRTQFQNLLAWLIESLRAEGVTADSRIVHHLPGQGALLATLPIAAYLTGFSFMQGVQGLDCGELGITHFLTTPHSPQLPLQGLGGAKLVMLRPGMPAGNAREIIAACPGPRSGDDVGPIIPSSGTTGIPKAVPITFEQFAIYCTQAPSAHPHICRSASLFPTPSLAGILRLLVSIAGGGCYFDAFRASAAQIEAFRPETLAGSPAQIAEFIRKRGGQPGVRLPRATCGGGLLSVPLAEAMREHFDEVYVGYGASEVGAVSEMAVDDDYLPGIVGVPWSGVEVQIVDSGDHSLPPGDEGVVRLRSGTMCGQYLGQADVHNAESFREGWFYPGDFGRLLADGRLQILGRETDHLNIGGMKVNALLIDEIAGSAEGIAEAACCVLPGQFDLGQLAALVVLEPGCDLASAGRSMVTAFRADPRVRRAMIPQRLLAVPNLPRNSNGKLMRHAATAIAQKALAGE
jgi:acyl-coenzyme A synthetase/AMP-(fatty) acid ligase